VVETFGMECEEDMADEEQSKNDVTAMSLEELVRLKKDVNQSITFGNSGLNARQVTELQKMDAKQWAKVRSDYREWAKGMRVLNIPVLLAIAVGGIVLWFYFKNWIGIVGAVCAVYAVAEIFKREGHREGYVDGYDAGFEGGFNRALGISDKEALEIHEKATEMKIDDISVAAFDKQKPNE
jgi:hypothetical protein